MNTNLQTVQAIYQAFGRKDFAVILEHVAPQVRWQHWADNSAQKAGVPYMQERQGHDGVLAFYKSLGDTVQVNSLKVLNFAAGDTIVVAQPAVDWTVKANGNALVDQIIHLWTFDEAGKVVGYQNFLDTAKHARALGLALPG